MGKMAELFIGIFALVSEMSSDAFANTTVKALLSVAKVVGLPLLGVSILMLCLKGILAVMDGNEFSTTEAFKRCVLGAVIYSFGVTIMKQFFLVFLDFTKDVIEALSSIKDFNVDLISDILPSSTMLLSLILLLIAIFYMFKTFLNLLERFWQYLITLCMLYVYIPSYVQGNDEALILWFKQCVSISLTQTFQIVVIVLGMNLYVSGGSFSDFAIGIGAVIAASKVDQLLDHYGRSAGGSMGKVAQSGMSAAFYAKNLIRR